MGWPRKNEQARIYFEPKERAYLAIWPVETWPSRGSLFYSATANALNGSCPSLCGCNVEVGYLRRCKRVQWSDLPREWKQAFREYFSRGGEKFNPRSIRGFRRV
jgi:hypothetical protein